jgi:hypothetical protein
MFDKLLSTQKAYRRKQIPLLSHKHKKLYTIMITKEWTKNREKKEEERIRKYMPITKYVCVNCGEGPYARDDDASDDDVQEKAQANNLMCERPFSMLNPWRPGTKKGSSIRLGSSYTRWWWDNADDNVRKLFAFEAWFEVWRLAVEEKSADSPMEPQKVMPSTGSLSKPRATLDLSRATLSYIKATQKCSTYVCVRCSGTLGLVNNLDPSGTKASETNPAYCPCCYTQATQNDLLKVEEQKKLRAASLAYKEARPNRELVSTFSRNLPEPHEVLTDFTAENLWAGGQGLRLITLRPLKINRYTRTEVNALLETVMNKHMNKFSGLQMTHTVVKANEPKYHLLTVPECKHHFGDHIVEIVKKSGYQVVKKKFVHETDMKNIDLNAESDDSEDTDRELDD